MLTIQEFFENTNRDMVRPRVHCVDGFNVSIQAGGGLYSTPRFSSDTYTSVELGYPSEEDDLISEFAEYIVDLPTESVYPYVPIDIVEELIKKHGGIDERKTFEVK